MSKRLVNPVKAFRKATHELASGNYESRVSIKRQDEIGDLAEDINQLAESLQANEKSRRQWVADIAHELRTPLSVIRSELEALQSGIRELNMPAINSLHEEALRLGRLVNDLYDLSITDLGALSYRKAEVSLNEVLKDSVNTMLDEFDKARISIDLQLANSAEAYLWADAQRLSQLFNNLLNNSLRYTKSPGHLTITTHLNQSDLTIDFEDSPPGVPDSSLPHLFERLYRVEHSRSRDSGGTGLGLAIAHNIVLAHGGEIAAMPAETGGLWIQIKLKVIKQ
jgi:two-component system sensor histidine kinase BaeS